MKADQYLVVMLDESRADEEASGSVVGVEGMIVDAPGPDQAIEVFLEQSGFIGDPGIPILVFSGADAHQFETAVGFKRTDAPPST